MSQQREEDKKVQTEVSLLIVDMRFVFGAVS